MALPSQNTALEKSKPSKTVNAGVAIIAVSALCAIAVVAAVFLLNKDRQDRREIESLRGQLVEAQSQLAALTETVAAVKADTTANLAASVAGIYRFEKPNVGMTEKMDLRSDGTAQTWYSNGYSSKQSGKKNVNWSVNLDRVMIANSTFKVEGDDLIDIAGNRWLRIR